MRIYLWDAGNYWGVTDDADRAMAAAAVCLADGGTARVERARAVMTSGLQPAYARLGMGWSGRLRGGRVTWAPLMRAAAA